MLLLGAAAVVATTALAWLPASARPRPGRYGAKGSAPAGVPRRGSARPVLRSVRCAVAAGTAFATASCLTQSLVMEISERGLRHSTGQPVLPAAAALTVVLAVAGPVWSQAACHSGLAVGLAVVSMANPVVADCAGMVLLDDRFRGGPVGALCAVAGAALAGRGVVILARPVPAPDPGDRLQTPARRPVRLTRTPPTVPVPLPCPASCLRPPPNRRHAAPQDGAPQHSGSIRHTT
ncbi:hypothetical protein [Streptomyces antibioticus]|uniref:hypothetical protein n=1 Tax=Streptomyces antibioticus TaxID=1890 RepID=UPI0033F0DE1B